MKRIVMTGGGTSGHVTPNIALFPVLKRLGFEIHYIGTRNGIERGLIEREGIPYHIISAGKLRRYLDMKNVYDAFRVMKGFVEAVSIIRKIKPNVVFSKGGFVSSPVVWAASVNRIPVIIHESDYTPGLANKISMPFAKKICYTFPETKQYIPDDKGILTGIPVRESLLKGSREKGLGICGFIENKPVIVVIGGSQGSKVLNDSIRHNLDFILKKFQVCHICGRGGVDKSLEKVRGYKQFEYINEDLSHIFAMADLVVSRAGATTIFELLALRKPNLLIPLSKKASRGDQILNANSFKKQGFSHVLMEEDLNDENFLNSLYKAYSNRRTMIEAMRSSDISNGIEKIIEVIQWATENR
ncbi:UDP-N-acetylglucosamine-N-acetylmuramylpentapeptide N-acetylglucosamine transferase [Caminicella sporogenes DSM 14501]|uniref:UDP-N-acetylglucosamine--N-acetylmuramyl-(pentapeptide) pyrophosphoryl-undecaprenol N-acetylglucosamine transferase n=1 Tax=Caminicella sporogenes DSM 14501 TaxID=1121266 RepID=A0A1M6NEP7_9FIRM|nr:undecaprenyldiphospho-muramoylpentapeptide beta-N-acetylglucosaminyltransferase [Caminicella sporogenes]SHJ94094.1 UDP-N-acetylglucosamine-N-acetylmuramylpentapeptide N-acetylglucosamine transferase [Caminicella sporogenes DSM 14501]